MPLTRAEALPAQIAALLPMDLLQVIQARGSNAGQEIEEIRLRLGRPMELVGAGVCPESPVGEGHMAHVFAAVTRVSVYAVEHDLRNGFVTVPGGHRVGLAGRAVLDGEGRVKALQDVSSVNIRLARARPGCSGVLSRAVVGKGNELLPTLILGPPLSGKTTILRDLARQLGNGSLHPRLPRLRVGIVDERSEIAGSVRGRPQFDIGLSTDVLDGCPKALGMSMMLRSMAPEVLVTDELGGSADARAVVDASRAGVAVVGTIHAASVDDVLSRPEFSDLLQVGAFQRFVVLRRSARGPGSVQAVYGRDLREVSEPWR